MARLGSADRGGQQPGEAFADDRNACRIEQVGAVVEPQPQPLARRRQQAQRIVRGVVPGDAGEAQAGGLGGETRLVDRIVLEHRQRVEQFTQAGQPLDLGEPQMLMRDQPRLAVLQVPSSSMNGLAGGSRRRSGSVLMNSPTMLSMPAISGGRPATVTPNTTSSRPVSRPSRMPQAAWM